MAKVSFSSLKLKTNDEVKIIKIGDKDIEVKQYLPISDKYDLVMITLQEAREDGLYNPIRKEVFFNLNIVFMYTNISFTDKQKEDLDKLYDILETNGIINTILEALPVREYEDLFGYLNMAEQKLIERDKSFFYAAKEFINSIPQVVEQATELINNFDSNKYLEVTEFAKSIGLKS